MNDQSSLPKRPRLEGFLAPASPLSAALRMGLGDDGSDDEDGHSRKGGLASSRLSAEAKRSQHCEVEKRRREKMNRYMSELAQMIPACNAVPRKLDKLSVLRMAVDHMKNLRGDPHSDSDYKPGFLTDDELKQLVVEAANGFMMIVSCERGRMLFVSDTITDVLSESPDKWLGSCFYDILHPKDIAKVKEQLACFDVEEALAASVKQNCNKSPLVAHPQNINGLRRSFLCRVRRSDRGGGEVGGAGDKEDVPDSTTGQHVSSLTGHIDKMSGANFTESESVLKLLQSSQDSMPNQYAVLHCTGYIRNLTPAERQSLQVKEEVGPCLVVVARLQHFGDTGPRRSAPSADNEFVARVGTDGRFTYVDPRVTGVLGYLPQDLIGQVSYEYFHPEDIQKMVQLHNDSMKQRGPMPTVRYRFLSKTQKWITLAMKSFSFVNPFSHQVEYVVCTNIALTASSPCDPTQPDNRSVANIVLGGLSPKSAALQQQQQQQQQQQHQPQQQPPQPHYHQQQQQQFMQQCNAEPSLPSDIMSLLPDFEAELRQRGTGSSVSLGQPLQQHPMASRQELSRSFPASMAQGHTSQPTAVVSSPANTTVSENRARAHQILDEYNRLTAPTPQRVDMNYEFPEGLFTTEVNLAGSAEAYQTLLGGLEPSNDLQQFLNQVEADPFKQTNLFGDLDFDVFD